MFKAILGKCLALFRMLMIIFLVALHGILVALVPEKKHKLRARVIQSFGKTLTWTLGIKIKQVGQAPNQTGILISNHRSYADIPVLCGISPVVFLAKAEVKSWPIIGFAARKARTVFVDRKDPQSRENSRTLLRERLGEGFSVLVFSEGTTTERGTLDPLKPGMFHEAAAAKLPIQLVYLEFAENEDSWVDDDPLSRHFFDRFSRWHTYVTVLFHEKAIYADPNHENPGQNLCHFATEWLHEQIINEVGELRIKSKS